MNSFMTIICSQYVLANSVSYLQNNLIKCHGIIPGFVYARNKFQQYLTKTNCTNKFHVIISMRLYTVLHVSA